MTLSTLCAFMVLPAWAGQMPSHALPQTSLPPLQRDIRQLAGVPPQWWACTEKEDCAVIFTGCSPDIPIAAPHKKETLAVINQYCHSNMTAACPVFACGPVHMKNTSVPDCVAGQCVARPQTFWERMGRLQF